MANTLPNRPPLPSTLFFVRANFGTAGTAFVETDPATNSRLQVVADIVSGEISSPLDIIECSPDFGVSRDISVEVARDIYAHVQDSGEPCPARLRDWFDLCLGVGSADQLDISTGNFSVDRTAQRIRAAAE